MTSTPRRFEHQALERARFHDCALAQARFVDVDLGRAQFEDVSFRGATFRNVDFSGASIEDANLAGLTIEGRTVAPAEALAAPRPFLPTRDLAVSTAFYEALGFDKLLEGDVAIFSTGAGGFILMRRFDAAWAENCMMQLMVDDLPRWWAHIVALDLPGRFGVPPPRPPALQSWGLTVAFLTDPAGVLWHIAQRRQGVRAD